MITRTINHNTHVPGIVNTFCATVEAALNVIVLTSDHF